MNASTPTSPNLRPGWVALGPAARSTSILMGQTRRGLVIPTTVPAVLRPVIASATGSAYAPGVLAISPCHEAPNHAAHPAAGGHDIWHQSRLWAAVETWLEDAE